MELQAAKWIEHLRRVPRNYAKVEDERAALPDSVDGARTSECPFWILNLKQTDSRNDREQGRGSPAPKASCQSRPCPLPAPREGRPTELIKQPENRPIAREQIIAEVRGISAGLVMVESKCIEVDNTQGSQNDPASKLNNDQWQALIALHRTLLHEHHDFFLVSQHPSASPALRRLAAKYPMPARMWRHGIRSFLALLKHRLPASVDHMLTFIYMAYSMVALLYETVSAFDDTWVECLGDLGRYRMAIEDDDIRDRGVWTAVSRHWYSRASDKTPTTGRLYHHLTILARPNALRQLYYYSSSVCADALLVSARETIMTLFEPILWLRTRNHQDAELPPTQVGDSETLLPHYDLAENTKYSNPFSYLHDTFQLDQGGIDQTLRQGAPLQGGPATMFTTIRPKGTPVRLDATATAASVITTWECFNNAINIVGQNFRSLLHLSFVLGMATLVSANPPIPHRIPKVLMVGTSAMASLGTGMTALQLNSPDDPQAAQHAKMALRIGSSACLAALVVGYTLWFLRGTHQKRRAFVYGFGACSFVLWLFVRPSLASPAAGGERDAFLWLDTVNLFGLVAVITGVLNAESSLFGSLFSQGRTGASEDIPLRGPDDEESRALVPQGRVNDASASSNAGGGGVGSLVAVLAENGFPLFGAYP